MYARVTIGNLIRAFSLKFKSSIVKVYNQEVKRGGGSGGGGCGVYRET